MDAAATRAAAIHLRAASALRRSLRGGRSASTARASPCFTCKVSAVACLLVAVCDACSLVCRVIVPAVLRLTHVPITHSHLACLCPSCFVAQSRWIARARWRMPSRGCAGAPSASTTQALAWRRTTRCRCRRITRTPAIDASLLGRAAHGDLALLGLVPCRELRVLHVCGYPSTQLLQARDPIHLWLAA